MVAGWRGSGWIFAGLKPLLSVYFIDIMIFISKNIWLEMIAPYLCTPLEKKWFSSLKIVNTL